ncbi:hypothetical protein SKAU_G00399450 [Synaphobranchus kaupii]|uniref:Uncharacterized protein n=1 Tax=Synaphobranchus kaupii TaxID=118154 RepID=A0A9Q1IC82_SYNKA|nr:hypothetical protein SKAU_G00399450 [Synaphobranchus kaupii]
MPVIGRGAAAPCSEEEIAARRGGPEDRAICRSAPGGVTVVPIVRWCRGALLSDWHNRQSAPVTVRDSDHMAA